MLSKKALLWMCCAFVVWMFFHKLVVLDNGDTLVYPVYLSETQRGQNQRSTSSGNISENIDEGQGQNYGSVKSSTMQGQGQILVTEANISDSTHALGEPTGNKSLHYDGEMAFKDMLQIVSNKDPKDSFLWNFSESVTENDIENMNRSLPPLLKNYRNPCWLEHLNTKHTYRTSYYFTSDCMEHDAVYKSFAWSSFNYYTRLKGGESWRLRCFPYFFVLGVSKSGTTDLYYSITRYLKEVISGARKEPHFWNRRRFGITKAGSCTNAPGLAATLSDYLDLYDEAAEKIRQRYEENRGVLHRNFITGDFTPCTLWSLPPWRTSKGNMARSEALYTTANHLYGLWPQAKLIIILRDPVERAFSQMRYRALPTDVSDVPATFHKLVIDTIQKVQQCANTRACLYNKTNPDNPDAIGNEIIVPGIYAVFIEDWLKVFPREQFLFLRFEDYKVNRTMELYEVAKFLDTAPPEASDRVKLSQKEVINSGVQTEDMWPRTRALLRQFYQPFNQRLAAILKNKDFTWGY